MIIIYFIHNYKHIIIYLHNYIMFIYRLHFFANSARYFSSHGFLDSYKMASRNTYLHFSLSRFIVVAVYHFQFRPHCARI